MNKKTSKNKFFENCYTLSIEEIETKKKFPKSFSFTLTFRKAWLTKLFQKREFFGREDFLGLRIKIFDHSAKKIEASAENFKIKKRFVPIFSLGRI